MIDLTIVMSLRLELEEKNDIAVKRFGEPAFDIDWERLEVTYRGKRRKGMFEDSDNAPNDPEQAWI